MSMYASFIAALLLVVVVVYAAAVVDSWLMRRQATKRLDEIIERLEAMKKGGAE